MKVKSAKYLVLLFILVLSISVPVFGYYTTEFGGGGSGVTFTPETLTYSSPAVYKAEVQTYTGASLESSATWKDSSYLSTSGNDLCILPYEEYISNNGSFSPSNLEAIAINVSFEVTSGYGYDGEFLVAYGVNVGPGMPNPGLYPADDGIVAYIEHADMANEQLIVKMNGVVIINATINSLSSGVSYTLGFYYNPSNYEVTAYWYNGTWYKYTSADVVQSGTSYVNEPIASNGQYFVIGASNAGPGYGYAGWVVESYSIIQNVEVEPPLTISLSYESVELSNGVHALVAYTGANNPVNVSVSSGESWTLEGITAQDNYSVSGSSYPLSSDIGYTAESDQILLTDHIYPAPTLSSWYVNITMEFQLVSSSSSQTVDITLPIFIIGFAEETEIQYPSGSYLSGQTVSITNTTLVNLPTNEGYSISQPIVAEIEINGVTSPLPYTETYTVSTPTTYDYTIFVEESGVLISSFSNSFTIEPIASSPVIFAIAPSTASYGSSITICFQFTQNAPISNITSFANSAGLLKFSYWQLESGSTTIILSLPQTKYGALVFVPASGNNIYIWFNGSSGLSFTTGENVLGLSATPGVTATLSLNGIEVDLDNTTQIMGIGIYNASFNWMYVDGAILQNAYSGQSYVISIGNSTASLSQYISGYTNASGWGKVSVPIEFHNFELINVYWSGVKNTLLNITVTTSSTSTSTSTSPTSTTYNYTSPFSNQIAPTSSLYNFSGEQPWATLIGLAIVIILALLGWKFGSTAGVTGGSVAGVIMSAYLGLLPWYIYFILILGVAMLLAKVFVDKFMGRDEM